MLWQQMLWRFSFFNLFHLPWYTKQNALTSTSGMHYIGCTEARVPWSSEYKLSHFYRWEYALMLCCCFFTTEKALWCMSCHSAFVVEGSSLGFLHYKNDCLILASKKTLFLRARKRLFTQHFLPHTASCCSAPRVFQCRVTISVHAVKYSSLSNSYSSPTGNWH